MRHAAHIGRAVRCAVLAAAAASCAAHAAPAAPGGTSAEAVDNRFDGWWRVTLECAKAADGAFGYTFDFPAQVKQGRLVGENGKEGAPSWLRLEGTSAPDGSARLTAHGITGERNYNVGGVPKGTRYSYHVDAQFEPARGTGRRIESRPCDFVFTRQ